MTGQHMRISRFFKIHFFLDASFFAPLPLDSGCSNCPSWVQSNAAWVCSSLTGMHVSKMYGITGNIWHEKQALISLICSTIDIVVKPVHLGAILAMLLGSYFQSYTTRLLLTWMRKYQYTRTTRWCFTYLKCFRWIWNGCWNLSKLHK